MTKKRTRAGLGWLLSVVLMTSGLVALGGAANADDPSPDPSPSVGLPSDVPLPTELPTELPTDGATDGATQPGPSATVVPSSIPSAIDSAVAAATQAAQPAPAAPESPSRAACGPCVAGTYAPPPGVTFNYPYGNKQSKNAIRKHVLQTILATPTGGSIHIAAFSINDSRTVNALIKAVKRGVAVQVVVNHHNLKATKSRASSPSFRKLYKVLGQKISRPGIPDDRVSFAKVCKGSCRGKGGNVHYKMFLFSSAGGVDGQAEQAISMMGSPNLTTLAAFGQWNHLVTLVNNQPTYDRYLAMFNEMKIDVPQPQPFRQYYDITPATWFFPDPGAGPNTDPLNLDLNQIRCTGVDPGYGTGDGRTLIRIGQYAWYSDRGVWLAKTVRALWNAGCDVAIEFAIMGQTVKNILYNPGGRGRIPMRQVATYGKDGTVLTYDHAKYLTISGAWGASNGTYKTWAGTTNFSNLGFYSDDSTQVLDGPDYYVAFTSDFARVWRGPKSHVPSPKSHVPGNVAGRIGKGKYSRLEKD